MTEIISLVEAVYHPHKNPDVISIMKMTDGNYVGEAMRPNKDGVLKEVRVRGGDPIAVLQGVLTHDGSEGTKTV